VSSSTPRTLGTLAVFVGGALLAACLPTRAARETAYAQNPTRGSVEKGKTAAHLHDQRDGSIVSVRGVVGDRLSCKLRHSGGWTDDEHWGTGENCTLFAHSSGGFRLLVTNEGVSPATYTIKVERSR
jgi:hypothetical protein